MYYPVPMKISLLSSLMRQPGRSLLWTTVISLLLLTLLLFVLFSTGAEHQVRELLNWIEARHHWAPLLFILCMAAAVVLVLPGIFLTLGAGFLFGLTLGTLVVLAGTLTGAVLAFLLARYWLGASLRQRLLTQSRLAIVSQNLSRRGWKMVLMIRLIPFFPGKLSNYALGLTGITLRDYVAGSAIGFVPFTLHNVYLGSLAADIATLGSRQSERTPLEWGLYLLGFLAVLVSLFWFNRLARQTLAQMAAHKAEES
jgi:uncharacterized membrane protein YdjX (TVP38/TMEM64 family)